MIDRVKSSRLLHKPICLQIVKTSMKTWKESLQSSYLKISSSRFSQQIKTKSIPLHFITSKRFLVINNSPLSNPDSRRLLSRCRWQEVEQQHIQLSLEDLSNRHLPSKLQLLEVTTLRVKEEGKSVKNRKLSSWNASMKK